MSTTPILIILSCYVAASILFWKRAVGNNHENSQLAAYSLLIIGLVSHLYLTINVAYVDHSFNFSVASMTLWISALLIVLFLIGNSILPIKNLALLIVPLGAFSVLFAYLWGDKQQLIDHQSTMFYWHIGFSIAGFTVLSLCVLQSLLFASQEHGIKNKRWLKWVKLLPALQIMEKLLFSLIWAGFVLISIAIILGGIVNSQNGNAFLSFDHHNLLGMLGWIVFAILLAGRYFRGWRGTQTVKWTVSGFVLIQLGYFGTKLVQESFL